MNVNEIFLSVSGECGMFRQGEWCVFLRLNGCNLRCSYCDTKRSLVGKGIKMSLIKVMKELIKKGLISQTRNLLITGGEPLLQQEELETLCYMLASSGIKIQIETNGTILPTQKLAELVNCWVFDYKSKQSFQRSVFNLRKESYREFWIKYPISKFSDYFVARSEVRKNPSFNHAFSAISPSMTHNELFKRMKKDKLQNVSLNVQLHKLASLNERGGAV